MSTVIWNKTSLRLITHMNLETTTQWLALRARENNSLYNISKPIMPTEAQDLRCVVVKWAYRVVDNYSLDRSVVVSGVSFDMFIKRCVIIFSRLFLRHLPSPTSIVLWTFIRAQLTLNVGSCLH